MYAPEVLHLQGIAAKLPAPTGMHFQSREACKLFQLGPSSVATPTEFNVWPSMATLSKPAKDSSGTDTS